jgi:single-strand DNA-binding protein
MANYNRVTLIGNLTRDIEMRATQGGMQVAKFGLAINRKSKDQETTCFVDCTAFDKSAELLHRYVRKGSPLFVEGRLEFSTWEAKDGSGKRSKLSVVVENFQFLSDGEQAPKRQATPKAQEEYGDIPF